MKKNNMKPFFILIVLIYLLVGCNNKSKKTSFVKVPYATEKNKSENYKVYTDNQIEIEIPNKWKPKKTKEALLYVSIQDSLDIYYVILKHTKNSIGVNVEGYVKEVFNELLEDSREINYYIKKINFENKKYCYFLELFRFENGRKYKIYSLIYPTDNIIYDFSYKTLNNDKNSINYKTFFEVLFSLKLNGKKLINGQNFIVDDAEILKFEDF